MSYNHQLHKIKCSLDSTNLILVFISLIFLFFSIAVINQLSKITNNQQMLQIERTKP